MYNRYLPEPQPADPPPQTKKHPNHCNGSGANRSLQLFGGRFGLDTDTLLALVVIWFLLSDGEIVQTDVLIIVALLFLLGL